MLFDAKSAGCFLAYSCPSLNIYFPTFFGIFGVGGTGRTRNGLNSFLERNHIRLN